MKIAIARLKRAAQSLHEMQHRVTIVSLAEELAVPYADVYRYVMGIPGLAKEICLTSGKTGPIITGKYADAVRRLQERGLMVTLDRIMFLTCAERTAVHMWFSRRDAVPDGLLKECEFRRRLLVARMHWMRVLHPDRRLTVDRIVEVAGYSREHLYRLMRKHRGFRTELGLAK
jgi:hypothetical protein